VGYQSFEETIEISQHTNRKIQLKPHANQTLEEVVVLLIVINLLNLPLAPPNAMRYS
jgi:hypothetical protein